MSKTIQIKKMNFHYSECPQGDLHNGQVMNLVCVDSTCTKRGLICPVCRMNNHEQHQILPLKIFLDEIKNIFMDSENSESLNSLSDYLRSIEQSRKELISILKSAAEDIAGEFEIIQKKIQDNYIAIRRNILAQSSISTKLPSFIQTLSQQKPQNAFSLQEQFQKYSQLIRFQNNKMTVSDKAKKLVEDYSKIPTQVRLILGEQVQLIKKSFSDSILCKSVVEQNKAIGNITTSYAFSEQNKSAEISLGENDKKAFTSEEVSNLVIAYLKGGEEQIQKKVTFKIQQSSSGSIILGMGDVSKDKEIAFFYNEPIAGQHFISSSTGSNQSPIDQSCSDDSIQNIDNFTFDEDGAEITVSLNIDSNEIVFEKKGTQLKRVVSISGFAGDKKKLQFFVVLAENDQVRIIDA